MLNKFYTCPVCGFDKLDEPPFDSFGCGSFDICPSCGTEFGYSDATASHTELRRRWIEKGAIWWSKSTQPPEDWDPWIQLRKAGF